ncbi:NAD(P)-dependent oxidoreductase [Rahnella aquatilis]|uniref:Beta-hydroxyacid dehydrogenase, 3-hydroxyisobutyrate dehydrogenase n=1 Tax=Rahnella aquatilis (strain ATCC 33071 / DSM 4594 / JCM 1683 / NBRC 105701 / NCIMB 13365 / CIP 78.65) TaxID=745277 RepID=H2J007_RAHAC|nr:NAD(P)-dependent oxidoreductase [Rahnella aquatilis]AEX52189.1 beta-hydroxyacid dehydrogenase, 3-hydroxyisobutyrate dehydrogenase [Rahnella aquatilis CIP 78.65 = ATCC 33071]KFD10656.1 putative dehydrogenase [Rahnella aquatilis CIP 78.65 = ATCC 33071]
MSQQQPTVAVLGLGAMGHAFAANLIKKGFTTRVWNRTASRGDDLVKAGAIRGRTPCETAEGADVVITMLSDGKTTLDVYQGDYGLLAGLKQGGIIAQMGTLGVEATESLIALINAQRPDVVFFDAPVSGTKAPAEQGQIVVLASGDREAGAAIEPVFAAISKATKWLGDAGRASKMKLVVNAWLIAMMEGIAETTQLAEALGFTPDDLWNVLEGGPLAAPYIKGKMEMFKSGDYTPQMQLTWALKDINLALEAGSNLQLPVMKRISQTWQSAVDGGYGGKDLAVVYHYLGNKS